MIISWRLSHRIKNKPLVTNFMTATDLVKDVEMSFEATYS